MVEILFEKVPENVCMTSDSIYHYPEWSWFEDLNHTKVAHFFTNRDEAIKFAEGRKASYAFAD